MADVEELHPGKCRALIPASASQAAHRCRNVVDGTEFCQLHDPKVKEQRRAHKLTALYQAEIALKTREKLTRLVTIRDPGDREILATKERYLQQLEQCAEKLVNESEVCSVMLYPQQFPCLLNRGHDGPHSFTAQPEGGA